MSKRRRREISQRYFAGPATPSGRVEAHGQHVCCLGHARLEPPLGPPLTDPLDQLRIAIRTFLVHSAEHPELLGLMNIEGRQDTERLAYIYDTYIQPALAPIERLLDHLADCGRTRPISPRAFHFLIAHGGAAPFTLVPLARHFDPADPRDPATVAEHAELVADLIVRGLEHHQA